MSLIVTFDCYGTLIDWLKGLRDALRKYLGLGDRLQDAFINIWGKRDLELVSSGYKPYRDILYEAFKYTLEKMDLEYSEDDVWKLVYSIKEWMPFSDVRDNLLRIKGHGLIGIISNTDREFILASIRNIGVSFDRVVVAEDIKLYKPNPRVFNLSRRLMGINRGDRWIHVSSYPEYDIIPARESGEDIELLLLNRYGYGGEDIRFADKVFDSFDELVDYIIRS